MSMTDEPDSGTAPINQGPTLYDSLVGMFLDPAATFRRIRERPSFLVPCLVLVLIGAASGVLIVEGIGFENLVRRQVEKSPFTSSLSAEAKEQAIQHALESPVQRYLSLIGPLLLPLVLVLLAGLLALILMVLGHSPGFARLFSVTVHSFLAYSLVVSVLSVLIVSLAQDPASLDPQNLIRSHLGVLVDEAESPVLFTLAASLDLITFYNLFLLSLGISVMCGRRAGLATGAGAVLVLWSLWVIGKTGLAILTA